jgi:hypothetical protein
MKPQFLIAGAALALLAGSAFAQPQGGGGVRAACSADFQKYCPDAKPGPGGGLRECVTANYKAFTKPCQDAIAEMRSRMQSGAAGGGKPN